MRSATGTTAALALFVVLGCGGTASSPQSSPTALPSNQADVEPADAAPAPAPAESLRLEGQVVDTGDNPVAGASVKLWVAGSQAAMAETTTEGDGSFAFDGVAAGDYVVAAEHADGVGSNRTTLAIDSDPVIVVIGR